ncbi:MAG: hypothetical protein Q9217_001717 [Psora testacea]
MATWEGIKPFNCEQGPKSANWICQTCHENGDESIVHERVIKLSGCTFPIQAKKISKEAKEAWRLFTTVSPKDSRQSAGGHLAAARKQQAQIRQPSVPSSPTRPSGNGPKKSLIVCLSVGNSQKDEQSRRRDSNVFPNLVSNGQDWSITPNRPPTPPESVSDSQDVANRSCKASPVKPNFAQPQDIQDQRLNESYKTSRQASEVSNLHGRQAAQIEEDDGEVSVISTTARKKRRLHRGLKERPSSPPVAPSSADDPPTKKLKLDPSFHSNGNLLEKWTNTAKSRAPELTMTSETAGTKDANLASLSTHQPDGASRSILPLQEMVDVPAGQPLVGVMEEPSRFAEEAVVHPIYPTSGQAKVKLPKVPPMGLDGTAAEEPSIHGKQNPAVDPLIESNQMPSDQQTANGNPSLPDGAAEEMLKESENVESVAVETIDDRSGFERGEDEVVQSTPKSAVNDKPQLLVVEADPIYNGTNATVRESLKEAAAHNFPPPHAWSNSTRASWDSVHALRGSQPTSDPRYLGKQRRSQLTGVSSFAPEVPSTLDFLQEQKLPKPVASTQDMDRTVTFEGVPQDMLMAPDGFTTYQQCPPSSVFTSASGITRMTNEANKTLSPSKSEASNQLASKSGTHVCQSTSTAQTHEKSAPQAKPKSMPSDYIEDMLAAARVTKATSPVTEPSYNIQWSAINAPPNKQGATQTPSGAEESQRASEMKNRKRRSRPPEPTSLPKLAPAPSPPAASGNEHQRNGSNMSNNARAERHPETATEVAAETAAEFLTTNQPLRQITMQPAPDVTYLGSTPSGHVSGNMQPDLKGNRSSLHPKQSQKYSDFGPPPSCERQVVPATAESPPKKGALGTSSNFASVSPPLLASHGYPWMNRPKSRSWSTRERGRSSSPATIRKKTESYREASQRTGSPQSGDQVRRMAASRERPDQGLQPVVADAMGNSQPDLETHDQGPNALPALEHADIFTRYPQRTSVRAAMMRPEATRQDFKQDHAGSSTTSSNVPAITHILPKPQTLNQPVHSRGCSGPLQQTMPIIHPPAFAQPPATTVPATPGSVPATLSNSQLPLSYAFFERNSSFSQPSQLANQVQDRRQSTEVDAMNGQNTRKASQRTLRPISTYPPPLGTSPAVQGDHGVHDVNNGTANGASVTAGQPMQPPTHAPSPVTQYLSHHFMQDPPQKIPGYDDQLRRHLQHTKLRICISDSTDTEIFRLGDCKSTRDFITKILTASRVEPSAVDKLRITFDWMPEGKKGRKFVMRLDDQADGFGHVYDEIHAKFRDMGYSVTVIDVDVLLKNK